MEEVTAARRVGRHEFNLASRKAEEAALRRYQAAHWLECLVGPLNISSQPSEREFISCLRNGLVLCNLINKIQPGSVPKVVESHANVESLTWDSQPLPAYQYFENVRNFLVAVEDLKLPAFEASVFERDNLDSGSAAKVVDCILALKAYHEWKQMTGGNGSYKPPRSPFIALSAGKIHARTLEPAGADSCRRLDMTAGCDKQSQEQHPIQKFEDVIIKALADHMVDSKENLDTKLLTSLQNGNTDRVELFSRLLSSFLEDKNQKQLPENKERLVLADNLRERTSLSVSAPTPGNSKCCGERLGNIRCKHWSLLKLQERELLSLKELLSCVKTEFLDLQCCLQNDLKDLGYQVQEMSTAALGYHKVIQENRKLYNIVQDLKGNIRVYCRIRPASSPEAKTVVDFIGEDGSLVVFDPMKPQKDGRKLFQFNRVFGPSATQDDVFRDTQPLIRSVMDGYNVCIFAYGQTGSGKTYTMCGPSGGLNKESGINYLALTDLFQLSDERKDIIKYDIRVQMVEIYNEQVRDLLAEDTSVNKLEIRSCTSDNGLALPNATMHLVKSTEDVLNLMKLGELNRAVGSTAINNRSSRSHSVLTVHVQGEDRSGSILRSCLHLVDLAGSERVDKSEVTGDGLKEAQYINKSLSCLGDVITALAQKNSHIPYRNSKLTLLLQNSLGGNAKTLMFAHMSPEGDSFGETVSTLKFAQRASTVELGAARSNKESSEVLDLKAQVENLKKALANREAPTPQANKSKEAARTPLEKPKVMAERTPPRSRRLSIENCDSIKFEKINFDDKKGPRTPLVQTRSRRLSLEGPKYANKDPEQSKMIEAIKKPVQEEATCLLKFAQVQEADAVTKPYECTVNGGSMVERSYLRTPLSPPSSAFKNKAVKTDNRTRIPSLQLPKTPEPPTNSRASIQNVMHEQIHSDFQTPGITNNTHGKGSHIRKSLRTIGKLINGSERRTQPKVSVVAPESLPVNDTISKCEIVSPIPSNARPLRRQSLTSIQPPERSRRSSLGGTMTDSCSNENRNSKTPPPVRASTKLTKRWL